MDADTRHQLKQNELAEALGRLRDWDNPTTRYTLLGLIAIVLLVAGWKGWSYSRQHAQEQATAQLGEFEAVIGAGDEAQIAAIIPDLREFIDTVSDPGLKTVARLWLARVRADQAVKDPNDREAALQDARDAYAAIVDSKNTPPVLEAAAQFGLATVSESLGDVDRARELYKDLTDNRRFAGSPYVDLASSRLENIDELRQEIALAEGTPPAGTEPPMQLPKDPSQLTQEQLNQLLQRERMRTREDAPPRMPTGNTAPTPLPGPTPQPTPPQEADDDAPADPEQPDQPESNDGDENDSP